jgi:hypothetical protein
MTWEESWRATDLVFDYVDWGEARSCPASPLDGSLRHIPTDGILEGTMTRTVPQTGYTATYTWHFEPDG